MDEVIVLSRAERNDRGLSAHRAVPTAPVKLLLSATLALLIALLVSGGSVTRTPSLGRPALVGIVRGPTPLKKVSSGLVKSPNWSGYAVVGGTYTNVVGSWVQPAVSCPSNAQEDAAFWVGIDGYSSSDSDVEQTGTDSDCNKGTKKVPGGPHYYAWWETATSSSVSSNTIKHTVEPGDAMTAEVSSSGGSYTLTLIDATEGWTASEGPLALSPTPAGASAEWIAEAPEVCKSAGKCSYTKLADFGSVTFSGASADGTPLSSFPSSQVAQIDMGKGKKIEASTSSLSDSSFAISWVTD
jgi:hypothetical protein